MRYNLGSILTSIFLLGVLLTPSVNQWTHLAEEHHLEKHCTENNLHFHTTELDCDLKATFTTPYTQTVLFFSIEKEEEGLKLEPIKPLLGYCLNQINPYHLRGPPQLLFSV